MDPRIFSLIISLFISTLLCAQSDEAIIKKIFADQEKSWNSGNLDNFMIGYWENDSLMYIGSSGITYGYAQTLARYKTKYSDTAKMGKLKFDIIKLNPIGQDHYLLVGRFYLKRSVGDLSGYFNLLWKKIDGQWKIILDHSS
ncbi:nuclear transport factor 2 family protein [Pollutibacter soli]|uniref:YybH family protein n=1 Tax=Pollutibacter soli TaxID=3034157 RepID=UPI0030133266